ncbi:MAG: nucleotidyltransferase domain-containing protein [Candidatus Muiribacteriota bacterium]
MAIKSDKQVNETLKLFIMELKTANIEYNDIYLFGSYLNGNPDEWSDIDVAISVSGKHDLFDLQLKIMKLARNVDVDIEPHVFKKKEFNKNHPLIFNILEHGKKIA